MKEIKEGLEKMSILEMANISKSFHKLIKTRTSIDTLENFLFNLLQTSTKSLNRLSNLCITNSIKI